MKMTKFINMYPELEAMVLDTISVPFEYIEGNSTADLLMDVKPYRYINLKRARHG